MYKLLTVIMAIIFAVAAQAQISKPRDPYAKPRPPGPKIGIGQFMQNQSMVFHFMNHVGWNESTMFEETQHTIKDLLIKMVSKNLEARQWIEEVNTYFESNAFKNLPKRIQEKEIFEAKMYAKISIQHYGVLKDAPKKKH